MADYSRSTNLSILKAHSDQHIPFSDTTNVTWRDAIASSQQMWRWMKEEI
jgi:hypothetical protein